MTHADKHGWLPIESAPTEHLTRGDLWVPSRRRVCNCVYSHAFDPPRWNEPVPGHPYAVREIEGMTHYRPITPPPEDT